MFNFKRNKKGFTIIELIVVIAILAILAAIAIPTFVGITDQANERVDLANARLIATEINTYNALNPNLTQIAAADAAAQTTLEGAGLWPEGLADLDATAALALITFSNGVAVVSEAAE